MSRERGRRLGNLLLAVAGVSVILLVVSRWAGKAGGGTGRGGADQDDETSAAQVGGVPDPPDLSFYRALGPGARKAATAPAGPARDAPPIALRETPAPAVGAPTVPGAHDTFVVQVLATRDRMQARRVRDRLAARGLATSVIAGSAGASPVYRVRVGPYRDRPGAESVVRRLRTERGLTPLILRQAG
jgi:cell division protein FtsN